MGKVSLGPGVLGMGSHPAGTEGPEANPQRPALSDAFPKTLPEPRMPQGELVCSCAFAECRKGAILRRYPWS